MSNDESAPLGPPPPDPATSPAAQPRPGYVRTQHGDEWPVHQIGYRLSRADTLELMERNGFNAEIRCYDCRATRIVPPAPLITLCLARGWDTNTFMLGRKFRCAACQSSKSEVRATVKAAAEPIGPVTVDDHRKIIRRMARLLYRGQLR